MRGPRLFLFFLPKVGEKTKRSKKRSSCRKCRVFTENIGKDQKKRSSLFMMKPLIFSEALGFSFLSLYVKLALHPNRSWPGTSGPVTETDPATYLKNKA